MSGLACLEREGFEALADALLQPEPGLDRSSLYLRAESSEFLRFNQAALRQATAVEQAAVTLAVERGQRRAESTLTLGGDLARDLERLRGERRLLVAQLDLIADDPWLMRPTGTTQSVRDERGHMPDAAALIALVRSLAGQRLRQDLVGFLAAGPVVHAFADSLGSRHWHRVETFHFDWCHYQQRDKAVKTSYAGSHWHDEAFAARVEDAARRVPLLERSARKLTPGAYRAAFAPAAMAELVGTLGWSGFSLKARRTGVSSLMRLVRGEAQFHAGFDLEEATADGTAPCFTPEGFVRPARVSLVEAGRAPADGGTLNSPRSAAEYGVPANGAGPEESPSSLRLGAGELAPGELLKALDTGLYVSNLWYLNYSDRQSCHVTGMTRYACFWVEAGQLMAPVEVMRFDDDLLRVFGSGLVGLGAQPELIANSGTYEARELGSQTMPEAVVEGFRLTL